MLALLACEEVLPEHILQARGAVGVIRGGMCEAPCVCVACAVACEHACEGLGGATQLLAEDADAEEGVIVHELCENVTGHDVDEELACPPALAQARGAWWCWSSTAL